MALTAKLAINGVPIGLVYVQRRDPPGQPDLDDICRYVWEVDVEGVVRTSSSLLEHRYGDGPLALIDKVIRASGHAHTTT